MLNEDKIALRDSTAAIRCKLIVKATLTQEEMVLTDEDAVKDWEYTDERYVPQQGFIGQFVARTLSGNLQNISDDFNIEGREIELQIGIVKIGSRFTYVTTEDGVQLMTEQGEYIILSDIGEDQINWYTLGNFIVTDPEDNEVSDNTKFEAMDYAKLFNQRFDGKYVDETYTRSYDDIIKDGESVTALWVAKYACAQVGVDFPQSEFTNSDFSINQNPFQAGESCRDVLKEISKLAYSWVRIGWDNKCYIDFDPQGDDEVDTYNIIDNNQYYELETKKVVYGPINNIVVGMSGIDGESHSVKDEASIAEHGEHTVYIYDNPLTNTFELRALAQKQASKLFGLTYAHIEVETVGHPWLQGNERINVLNMENESTFTYAFNRSVSYSGHIRSTISSMGDSEVESTLAYESDIIKNIRNASINVDKQNGKIDAMVEEITSEDGIILTRVNQLSLTVDGTISRVSSVEDSVTKLGDDIDDKLDLISDDIDGVQLNLDEFIDNEYVQGISNLQKQIDGAIQFWNGPEIPTLNNYPAKDWKTENEKINHQADIYTVIEDVDGELKQGKSYRFDKVNGNWVWIELTDNELSAVQKLAQDAFEKAGINEGNIVTLNSNVSDLIQKDTEITASIDSIENTLVPLADASGSNIYVDDSANAALSKFIVEGKSTQETRSGKNLFDYVTTFRSSNGGLTNTINADGSITVSGAITGDYIGITMITDITNLLEDGQKYTAWQSTPSTKVFMEIRSRNVSDNSIKNYYGTQAGYNTLTINKSLYTYDARIVTSNKANFGTESITFTSFFQLEKGDKQTAFEKYGVAPSPDYPSNIRSVGYENLFNFDNILYKTHSTRITMTGSANNFTLSSTHSTGYDSVTWNLGKINYDKIYYSFGTDVTTSSQYGYVMVSPDGTYENRINLFEIKDTNNSVDLSQYQDYYLLILFRANAKTLYVSQTITNLIVSKNDVKSYIPYGKYGIEVKTVGKNLFDVSVIKTYEQNGITYTVLEDGSVSISGTATANSYLNFILPNTIEAGTTLTWSANNSVSSGVVGIRLAGKTSFDSSYGTLNKVNRTHTYTINDYVDKFTIRVANGATLDNYIIKPQLEEGSVATEYQPYQERITVIQLNAPLRSLPNGTKDIAYIKNSRLYVDRYVGSKIFDGSETWNKSGYTNENIFVGAVDISEIMKTKKGDSLNSHFVYEIYNFEKEGYKLYNVTSEGYVNHLALGLKITETPDIATFKTWLTENNIEVIYELATPVIEDYGEVDYPFTQKNVTYMSISDDLKPNINITYTRTGSMTDYISGQFTEKDIIQNRRLSELSVRADSISASVTSVTGDLADTNVQLKKLEATMTDQEATIKIVSSNINKDTGTLSVSEVTTTNGFTFNDQGLNIYTSEDSFNTQINNTGTFYKDGEEIIGKTTKDGSLLKNLTLQGQTTYGDNGSGYDFIEERVYADNEYCYATFYNGEE